MQGCSDCQNDPMKLLNSAVQDLDTLSSVFYGGSQSSLRKLNSLRRLDLLRYESEELLTKSTMGKNIKKNLHNICHFNLTVLFRNCVHTSSDFENYMVVCQN